MKETVIIAGVSVEHMFHFYRNKDIEILCISAVHGKQTFEVLHCPGFQLLNVLFNSISLDIETMPNCGEQVINYL